MSRTGEPAGRLPPLAQRSRVRPLSGVTPDEAAQELLRLLEAGQTCQPDVAGALAMQLEATCDAHENRFGVRRLRDLFAMSWGFEAASPFRFDGATVVDLGCGGRNPLGLLTVFLLLGAERGIGVDLDEIGDVRLAVRGIARAASLMLLDPGLIVGRYPIGRAQVAAHADGFDFAKIYRGDVAGVPQDRLCFRRESVYELSLGDGEVDFLVSNSFLEHVPDPEQALQQLARVTKPGGYGAHNIDGVDHRLYGDPGVAPLAFLAEPGAQPLVFGSNRLRPLQFAELFERAGFDVLEVRPLHEVTVTPTMRETFAEPFRSLPDDVLRWTRGQLFVRRR